MFPRRAACCLESLRNDPAGLQHIRGAVGYDLVYRPAKTLNHSQLRLSQHNSRLAIGKPAGINT